MNEYAKEVLNRQLKILRNKQPEKDNSVLELTEDLSNAINTAKEGLVQIKALEDVLANA